MTTAPECSRGLLAVGSFFGNRQGSYFWEGANFLTQPGPKKVIIFRLSKNTKSFSFSPSHEVIGFDRNLSCFSWRSLIPIF